jgi:hypothetical protein
MLIVVAFVLLLLLPSPWNLLAFGVAGHFAIRPEGQVRLDGEIWAARSASGAVIHDSVRVVGRDRLTLIVEPAPGDGR